MSSTGLVSSAGPGKLFPPLCGSGGLLNGTCTWLLDIDWAIGLLLGAGFLEVFLDLLLVGFSSSSTDLIWLQLLSALRLLRRSSCHLLPSLVLVGRLILTPGTI